MTLTIVGQSCAERAVRGTFRNFLHLTCPNCGQPSAVEVEADSGQPMQLGQVAGVVLTINQIGWHVARIWPEPPAPRLPEHLPDPVAKAYLAAERTFAQPELEEASAGSYGRALDIATKLYAPEHSSLTLYSRIKKLAAEHRITAELAEWAHAIRLIRNDALHGIDSITRDELKAIRGFTETVLTYLFTLPGMLKARQAETTERPGTETGPST